MKTSTKKILSLSLLIVGLLAIIPSSSIAAKYKKSEGVIAADFMEDGKIVFVKNIKIESFPLFYDPHSWITGGPVKTLSNKLYLCTMNKDGGNEERVFTFPKFYIPIRFWKGEKFAVIDAEAVENPDGKDIRHFRILVFDILNYSSSTVFEDEITIFGPKEGLELVSNLLWTVDGQSILIRRGHGERISKINLLTLEVSPSSKEEWDSAWGPSSTINQGILRNIPNINSEAFDLAERLSKTGEVYWLFFKPPWWKN